MSISAFYFILISILITNFVQDNKVSASPMPSPTQNQVWRDNIKIADTTVPKASGARIGPFPNKNPSGKSFYDNYDLHMFMARKAAFEEGFYLGRSSAMRSVMGGSGMRMRCDPMRPNTANTRCLSSWFGFGSGGDESFMPPPQQPSQQEFPMVFVVSPDYSDAGQDFGDFYQYGPSYGQGQDLDFLAEDLAQPQLPPQIIISPDGDIDVVSASGDLLN